MALADYFHRSAVAAAQILSGFDEAAIRQRLENTSVGVTLGQDSQGTEGEKCAELAVRLLARLYPRLRIDGPNAALLTQLAEQINPNIELIEKPTAINLCVGTTEATGDTNFYLGSSGWDAYFSPTDSRPVGNSHNAFGAGAAACLGASAVFRAVFLENSDPQPEVTFSCLDAEPRPSTEFFLETPVIVPPKTVLVGAGAIGQGALWALSNSNVGGDLVVVDPEPLELGNLQRYILGRLTDVGKAKVQLAADLVEDISVKAHVLPWAQFVANNGYGWERVLTAVDTAADRRGVQAALPRWIANAWTQPNDLGVSVHPWPHGACLNCLYLPKGEVPSEDEQVALAFGLPQRRQDIRRLLVGNEPTPSELLAEAATALQINPEPLLAFEGRPLREIYVEGLCGGAAVPLDRVGAPAADVHVPLAHQSAMAGILLAARLIGDLTGRVTSNAEATHIDMQRPLGSRLTIPIAKDPRNICICQDSIYEEIYREKWGVSVPRVA